MVANLPRSRSRTWRWQAAGRAALVVNLPLLLLLLLNLAWFALEDRGIIQGDAFVRPQGSDFWEAGRTRLGEPVLGALFIPVVQGERPIHVDRLEMITVPDGLVIDRFSARRQSTARAEMPMGIHISRLKPDNPLLQGYVPVDQVVLDPTCPPSANCGEGSVLLNDPTERAQDWLFLVQAHITKPGRFFGSGVRIYYDIDGRHFQEDIPAYRFGISS